MKIKKAVIALLFAGFTYAQENITYQQPSAEILQLADFQRAPAVVMNSKKDWMVFTYRNTYKSLDELNQPEMKLAGLRVNPVTNIGSTITYTNNLKVRRLKDKSETQVKGLPANPKISYISFSPDEQKLAFTNTTSKGVELWVLDLATATAKKTKQRQPECQSGYAIYLDEGFAASFS